MTVALGYRLMAKCSCLMLHGEEGNTATHATLYLFGGFISKVSYKRTESL